MLQIQYQLQTMKKTRFTEARILKVLKQQKAGSKVSD